MWGVEGKGLIRRVPSGRSLQPTHVGAVTKFGLGVAPNVFILLGFLQEELVLFGSSLVAEGFLNGKLLATRPMEFAEGVSQ